MKKQKPVRLFRALIVSSTLSGIASQTWAQDGVANTGSGASGPEGAANVGASQADGVAPVPSYELPQYAPGFSSNAPDWFSFNPQRIWQDEFGPRFRLETRIGEWLGSEDQGDAGFNVMLPFRATNSDFVFFIDGRGTVTYDGGGAANAGIGLRYFDRNRNRVWGLSGWYDLDDGNRRDYHQFGVSFESLGKWVDFHLNGYFPFSHDTRVLSTQFANPVFTGNGVQLDQIRVIESAFGGLNAEIGGPLPVLGRYGFEGYVGGYYYQNDDDEDITGPSVRLQANVTDDLILGINVTHDDVFDTQVFGTVSLTLPDGRPQRIFRPRKPEERLLARVERRYRMVTNRRTQVTQVPGLGGGIGQIIFINPDAAVNGTGTFESPLNTLVGFAGAPANTLFLIDDPTANGGNNLNGTLTLQDNSRIFSLNFTNTHPVIVDTLAGPIALPQFNPTAVRPTWSNPTGGTILTLAGDNTEVAGIIFDGVTGNPAIPASTIIAGTAIQGFSIHDNEFRNYTNAILLNNATGTIAAGNPGIIHSNSFYGRSGVSQSAFNLTNNGPGTLDLEFGLTDFVLAATNGTGTANFALGNSGEDTNGNGVLDAGEDQNANGMLDGGVAFSVTARNRAVINANVIGNVTGTEDLNEDGVFTTEDLNRNGVLDLGEDVNGNNILDFGEDLNRNGVQDTGNSQGFVFNAGASQSVINLRMVDNLVDRNVREGVVLAANSSTINAGTIGEDVNGNGLLDGFEDRNGNGFLDPSEDLDGDGVLDASEDINGNGVLDTGEDLDGDGMLDLTEDRNGNGLLDLAEDLDGDGRIDLGEDANEDRNGNGILDIGEDLNGDGLLNLGNGNGQLDGGRIITANEITRNGGDGIRVNMTNNATVNLRMTANQIGRSDDRSRGNRGVGLNVNADSGSLVANLGFLYNEDVNVNGVLDIGEDTNGNGALDTPQAADGNEFVANLLGGVNFNLNGTAVAQINAIGNTIEGIGGGALGFLVSGDTTGSPLIFTNDSLTGLDVSRIQWNIAAAGLEFNTDVTQGGAPFSINNTSDLTTGLQSVNGTTGPFTVQDLATALDLVFNDFNPPNGILDAGEDLDADNVLDPGEDLPEAFNFQIDIDQAGTPSNVFGNQLIGSIVTATFSSGQVLTGTMQAVAGDPLGSQFVVTQNNSGTGNGFAIRTADNAVLQPSLILNNTIANHGGNGISVVSSEEGNVQNLLIRNNTITGNGSGTGIAPFSSGIALSTMNSVGANARLNASILLNNLSNNVGGAVDAFANSGLLTLLNVQQNTIDGNGSGISLSAAQAATLTARVTNNTITDSVKSVADNDTVSTNDTLGDGLVVNANAGNVILNEVAFNTIATNAGDGISLTATNAGTITVTPNEDLNNNGVLDPGEDVNEDLNNDGVLDPGEDTNGDGFLNTGNANGFLDRGILSNSIVNNGGLAFSMQATNSTVDLSNVRNNSIVTNSQGTGNFFLIGNNSALTATFTGNSVIGDFTNNPGGGPGLLVSATGGSFDVRVGGPNAADRNTFSGNRGAGIAFVLSDTGTGSFVIQNNSITRIGDDNEDANGNGILDAGEDTNGNGILDGANTPFDGDGINVSLVGSTNIVDATAVLTRSDIVGNLIGDLTNANLGLAGSGIAVLAAENTMIEDLLIDSNTIGHAGNDNTSALGDDDAGIEFDRLDDAEFNIVNPRPGQTLAVTISNNISRNNVGQNNVSPVDGLDVNVMNGIRDDIDFDIRDNEFGGNTGEGINFTTQADASLAANLTSNLIENNQLNGIHLEGVENVAADLETQGGTWIKNIIRRNGLNGIQIDGVSGDVVPLIIGQLGTDPLDGQSLGNTIENNGTSGTVGFASGIQINSGGFAQINNNIISSNFEHGLDVNADGIGLRAVLLQRNSIVDNGGDGVEWLTTNLNFTTSYLLAFGNSIDGNDGRGIDVLTSGNAIANIRLGDDTFDGMNNITSNGGEGVYIVTTTSLNQRQDVPSDQDLLADGNVFRQADMVLDMRRNFIGANNNTNNFIGGGLVLRVGSSNSDGFFAPADTSGTSFLGNAFGNNDAIFGNGRINARVVNNEFEGNLGDDVMIESFTSTVNPIQTNGTWDAMTFTIMAYQSDPLARLNLVFRGNTGNSINVTRGHFNRSTVPGQSNVTGAFYNNAEDTFKSRINTQTPPGPFTSGTRRRNAQRVTSRGSALNPLPPNPLTSPDLGFFEYAGMGPSTFRVESDFDVSGFQAGDTFLIDGAPYDPLTSPNGVPFTPAILFGELPFGWTAENPGTFQFDPAFQIPGFP